MFFFISICHIRKWINDQMLFWIFTIIFFIFFKHNYYINSFPFSSLLYSKDKKRSVRWPFLPMIDGEELFFNFNGWHSPLFPEKSLTFPGKSELKISLSIPIERYRLVTISYRGRNFFRVHLIDHGSSNKQAAIRCMCGRGINVHETELLR